LDPKLSRSIGHPIIEQIRHERRFDRPGGGKFVHVEDVVAAVAACVGNEAASGQIYDLADCYARWADWAVIAADLLGIDAKVDLSSPAQPKNRFSKEAALSLGVALDRGHDGIRAHLRELIEAMERVEVQGGR
jgi:nucleoside-diphosphate-sugar epimerase